MGKDVKWLGLVDTHSLCRDADAKLFDATLAAAAFAPRVVGFGGMADGNVEFVAKSVRDGMLGVATAAIAAAHQRLTTEPPRLALALPMTRPTPAQEKALWQVCLWRVAQIWYGPVSAETYRMRQRMHNNLVTLTRADPHATESLVVALCYAMCAREHVVAGGEVAPFVSTCVRAFLNNDSALLDDPLAAYCLLESANSAVVYRHLSARLQGSIRLNMHLVQLAGDDVLCLVPPEVYADEKGSHAIRLVRRLHYSNNPMRKPWLRVLAKRPSLVFGRGSLDLVDVEGWRALG